MHARDRILSTMLRRTFALSLGLLALRPTSASALSARTLDLSELVTRSQCVVHVHVQRAQAAYFGDLIVTRSRCAPLEYLAGQPRSDRTFEVTLPGGEVDDVGLHVPGVEPLEVGSEYVVFLRERAAQLVPVGLAQGTLRVTREGAVREVVTSLPLARSRLASDGTRRVPLDVLREALREATTVPTR